MSDTLDKIQADLDRLCKMLRTFLEVQELAKTVNAIVPPADPEIWVLEWDDDDDDSRGSTSLAFEYYPSMEAAMVAGEEFASKMNSTDVLPAVWTQTSDLDAEALVYRGTVKGYVGLLYVARLAKKG